LTILIIDDMISLLKNLNDLYLCCNLQADVENLERLFETLNIQTEVLHDLGYKDFKDAMKKFCEETDFENASMAVFVLMAHGDDDSVLYTANGRTIKTEEIIDLFYDENCPNLKGKPKWFIFQVKVSPFCD